METVLFLGGLVDMAIAANSRAREDDIFCNFSLCGGFSMESPICKRRRQDDISCRDNPRNDDCDDNRKSSYLLRNFS
ncbi:MAG: hypothetical protein HYY46_17910 [Deltaproteobacteria bacterium]|nr:hypothetical protein [Deltaproteobacteria bacterium]